jgi:hypothetical protein
MKIADSPEAYGYTIFCDDIRLEVAGKMTFVGVYTGEMTIYTPSFPTVLPKIALSISYRQRFDKVVSPVQFRVLFPWDQNEDSPFVFDPPNDGLAEAAEGARRLAEESKEVAFASMTFNFFFSPFVISSPGLIKVRAVRGDELVKLGGLRITQGDPSAVQQFGVPQAPT